VQQLIHVTDLCRYCIQFLPARRVRPIGDDAKSVAREPRDDVQMHMKDFLEGGFAVREEEIDALASDAGVADRLRHPGSDDEQVRADLCVQTRERRDMPAWHDEEVAGVDRGDV